MATFTEPFTTSLALTWTTVVGNGIVMSGTTAGTLDGGAEIRVRAEHDVGSADMFSQVTWVSGGADSDRAQGVMTRCSTVADTCYSFEVNDFFERWQFLRFNAGTPTSISGGTVSRTISVPTTIRLESEGTTHRCMIDGVTVGTYSDGNIATNQRGGLYSYRSETLIVVDNFSTGDLPAPTIDALRRPIQTIQIP